MEEINWKRKSIERKMKLKSLHAYLRNKELINQFIEREVAIKYRGSVLGITWAVITPLTMLTIYSSILKYIQRKVGNKYR